MTVFHQDSYCGIYCGACSVYRYGESGQPDGFTACLAGVPQTEMACGGCKSDHVYAGCRLCKLRICAVDKGIAHCGNCADYPCAVFRKWRSAARILPHVKEAAQSIEAIRQGGIDSWMAEQKKRWACPDCGTLFSWYATACLACGRSLESKAYKMAGWKKLLCRFLLPRLYRKAADKAK